MRAKRTIALLASPLVAAAALAFSPAVMSQATAATTNASTSATSTVPNATPKQRGYVDGYADGTTDGQNTCDYRRSFFPQNPGLLYLDGYRAGYASGYGNFC